MAKRRVLDGVGGNRNEADTRLDALVMTSQIIRLTGKGNAQLHYLPEALPTTPVTLGNAGPAEGVTALPTPYGGNAGNSTVPSTTVTPTPNEGEEAGR